MKVFINNGIYGKIIVAANNEKEADELVKKEYLDNGLKEDDLPANFWVESSCLIANVNKPKILYD